MSLSADAQSFLDLASAVRALGAVKLEKTEHGYAVVFDVPSRAQAITREPVPPKVPPKKPANEAEARELLRQRELGKI